MMNTFRLFLFLLSCASSVAFAQYNYNNSGRGDYMDRYVGGKQVSQGKTSAEDLEKMRNEGIDKFVAKLKSELELDDLQVIAVKNEMISNAKNVDIVLKKENSEEAKTEEVKALREKLDITIKSYLNKSQKEKFDVVVAEIKSNRKEKKDKKDKKAEDQP